VCWKRIIATKRMRRAGTAVKIAQILAEAYGRDLSKVGVYERKGLSASAAKTRSASRRCALEILSAIIPSLGGQGERLDSSTAPTAATLLSWALRAARWIIDKTNGLYDMQDCWG